MMETKMMMTMKSMKGEEVECEEASPRGPSQAMRCRWKPKRKARERIGPMRVGLLLDRGKCDSGTEIGRQRQPNGYADVGAWAVGGDGDKSRKEQGTQSANAKRVDVEKRSERISEHTHTRTPLPHTFLGSRKRAQKEVPIGSLFAASMFRQRALKREACQPSTSTIRGLLARYSSPLLFLRSKKKKATLCIFWLQSHTAHTHACTHALDLSFFLSFSFWDQQQDPLLSLSSFHWNSALPFRVDHGRYRTQTRTQRPTGRRD